MARLADAVWCALAGGLLHVGNYWHALQDCSVSGLVASSESRPRSCQGAEHEKGTAPGANRSPDVRPRVGIGTAVAVGILAKVVYLPRGTCADFDQRVVVVQPAFGHHGLSKPNRSNRSRYSQCGQRKKGVDMLMTSRLGKHVITNFADPTLVGSPIF